MLYFGFGHYCIALLCIPFLISTCTLLTALAYSLSRICHYVTFYLLEWYLEMHKGKPEN